MARRTWTGAIVATCVLPLLLTVSVCSSSAEAHRHALERARQDIEEHGWHLVMVSTDGRTPSFVYTIGLWQTYRHPEILLFTPGSDPERLAPVLHEMVRKMKANGVELAPGQTLEEAFGPFPGFVRPVLPRWRPSYLGLALSHYGEEFPVVQLYWPDKKRRFPWRSGFDDDLYRAQPLLYQENAILAGIGWEEVRRLEDGHDLLEEALDDLLVEVPDDRALFLLEEWRWKIGPDTRLLAVTLFGDLFLEGPEGEIQWLDTSYGELEELTRDREEWRRFMVEVPQAFFHPSVLLHARDMGYRLEEGNVYDWIQSPRLGGDETVDNLQQVIPLVRISHAGRTVGAMQRADRGEAAGPAFEEDDGVRYSVVINEEEQYSIWPEGREVPEGWTPVGFSGTKSECLEHIAEVWVDMRPKSLREMQEREQGPGGS